jgi:Fe-S-cluster containining protein
MTSLQLFRTLHSGFAATLSAQKRGDADVGALLAAAFSHVDATVDARCAGMPPLACRKGCATCCSIRVTATAPEVLWVARHLREACEPGQCVRLVRRLLEADAQTRDLDESERVALRQRCPFIEQGACVIYAVRPLACRGHASYDRKACAQAAAGRIAEVPYSVLHQTARSLVQNAMQSALRDAGVVWAAYELNHALRLALADPASEARWQAGHDVFADAQVSEVDPAEMAEAFDRLKAQA